MPSCDEGDPRFIVPQVCLCLLQLGLLITEIIVYDFLWSWIILAAMLAVLAVQLGVFDRVAGPR